HLLDDLQTKYSSRETSGVRVRAPPLRACRRCFATVSDASRTCAKNVVVRCRMDTTLNALAHLCERELLEHFENLVTGDRRTTAQLLVAIAEIDERKLWAKHACQSMFVFCVERFHMSEQVTAKRIWAARTARRFPVVLEMVERGELHLSAIHLLARHLTLQNCDDVLRRARHKSSREIERIVAALAPRPDVASSVRALARTVVDTAQTGGASAAQTGGASAAEADGAAADSDGATTRSESASVPASATAAAMRSCSAQS